MITINYLVQGLPSQNCCYYPVLPAPQAPSGQIEIVDCNNVVQTGQGGIAVVNADAGCSCQQIVRVEETT